jgi:anti-anti-sigma factor
MNTGRPPSQPAQTIYLTGDIDTSNADKISAHLIAAIDSQPGRALQANLSQLRFVDSSGIRALLQARRYAVEHGVAFAVTEAQPMVRRILDVTGVAGVLGLT